MPRGELEMTASISQLHEQAMDAAENALLMRRRGNHRAAEIEFRRAYELERQAAFQLFPVHDAEPTRGVLFRSAATLALDVGELEAAEALAAAGLAGLNVSAGVQAELRAVLEDVKQRRVCRRCASRRP